VFNQFNQIDLIMPTYTRQCLECEHIFDKLCKISEKSTITVECPYCGGTHGVWMLDSPHFTLRGDRLMTQKKDSGFKEVLQKIQERNPRTAISEI
jgi:putative FmdB family regulatory protein